MKSFHFLRIIALPNLMPTKLHFHTLDALRFFAFFKVFLLHLPAGVNMPIYAFLKSGGGIGVCFFFVLSGFLITYILTYEKLHKGQINLKQFFLRRSFRIWPLFFLVVTIVALLPYDLKQSLGLHMISNGYAFDWRYSFTFTENYKMIATDNHPQTTPLLVFWSLCIEEHFYILWMLVVFVLPVKRIPFFLLASILVAWIARFIEPNITHNVNIISDDVFTNLDYFAIGGIPAYYVAKDYKKMAGLIGRIPVYVQRLILLIAILAVVFQQYLFPITTINYYHVIRPTIIALVFVAVICIFIPADSKLKIGERSILTRLGKISFGLYVFHLFFIHMALQYCIKHNIKLENVWQIVTFAIITFAATVISSLLSYVYFEKKWLLLREKL